MKLRSELGHHSYKKIEWYPGERYELSFNCLDLSVNRILVENEINISVVNIYFFKLIKKSHIDGIFDLFFFPNRDLSSNLLQNT